MKPCDWGCWGIFCHTTNPVEGEGNTCAVCNRKVGQDDVSVPTIYLSASMGDSFINDLSLFLSMGVSLINLYLRRIHLSAACIHRKRNLWNIERVPPCNQFLVSLPSLATYELSSTKTLKHESLKKTSSYPPRGLHFVCNPV